MKPQTKDDDENTMPELKKLNIAWLDLEAAFEHVPSDFGDFAEYENYFDLETGRVAFLNENMLAALDQMEAALQDELPEGGERFQLWLQAREQSITPTTPVLVVELMTSDLSTQRH